MQGRALSEEETRAMRARLAQAAMSLLEAEGREACSLRRVGAEAGVSRSTPYTYFVDKEALLDAVRAASLEHLCDATTVAMQDAPSIEASLAAVGHAYVRFALEHPALYELIFESHQAGAEHEAAVARYRALAEAPLTAAHAAGLTRMEPARLGQVLWAATHGALALHRAGKLRHGVELEQLMHDLGDVLAFGFAVPQERAS